MFSGYIVAPSRAVLITPGSSSPASSPKLARSVRYKIRRDEMGRTSAASIPSLGEVHEAELPLLTTIIKHDTDASTLCTFPYSCYFESTKEAVQTTHTIRELRSADNFTTPPPIGEIRIDAAGRDLTQELLAMQAPRGRSIRLRAKRFWKDQDDMVNHWYDRFSQIPESPQGEQSQGPSAQESMARYRRDEAAERSDSSHCFSDPPPGAFHAQFDFFDTAPSERWGWALIEQRQTAVSVEGVAARSWPTYYAPPPPELETRPRESQMGPPPVLARAAPRTLGPDNGGKPLPNIYDEQSAGAKALSRRIQRYTSVPTTHHQRYSSGQGSSHGQRYLHGQTQRPTHVPDYREMQPSSTSPMPHMASGGRSGLEPDTGTPRQFEYLQRIQQSGYAACAMRLLARQRNAGEAVWR